MLKIKNGMKCLSEKQIEMIKMIEVDKSSWEEFRNAFEYSSINTAQSGYREAKKKEKILKSKNEKM